MKSKLLLLGIFSAFFSCSPKIAKISAVEKFDLSQKLTGIDCTFVNTKFHEVRPIIFQAKSKKPKNIIFMLGDGMGLAQMYAGMTANKGKLNLENASHTGLHKTYSSDGYITDSAAGATAFSAGVKTYNAAIGMDKDSLAVKTILEYAEEKGLATGLVATSTITHASPASFIAHKKHRNMYEAIATDFLKTDIDVFIGGGKDHFSKRKDGKNLLVELKNKGYQVLENIDEIAKVKSGKLAGLVAAEQPARYSEGRDEMLSKATKTAINLLKQNEKGFFLMIEGSQIDWGGHANDLRYVVEEMLDFDKVIGEVFEFAAKDGETLVIITADHETGGLTLNGGSIAQAKVRGIFTSSYHTAVPVPVYAFGVGAENFTGIYENIAIFDKMMDLFGFEKTK
ncbi:MAG: alkaline phosphatase [Bacteroidetes bacterium]|nr:MAG: alkaline phosphatase [Bacteroidota bacterium]